MSIQLDPKEVLEHLNHLGYYNITGEQLVEFMKDLKKLIKYDLQNRNQSIRGRSKSYENRTRDCTAFSENRTQDSIADTESRTQDCTACRAAFPTSEFVDQDSCFPPISFKVVRTQAQPQNESDVRSGTNSESVGSLCSCCADTVDDVSQNVQHKSQTAQSRPKENIPPRPKSFIRSRELSSSRPGSASGISKCDPVSLYQKYQAVWSRQKLPGENNHADLRWAIRERMLGQQPGQCPCSCQPCTYADRRPLKQVKSPTTNPQANEITFQSHYRTQPTFNSHNPIYPNYESHNEKLPSVETDMTFIPTCTSTPIHAKSPVCTSQICPVASPPDCFMPLPSEAPDDLTQPTNTPQKLNSLTDLNNFADIDPSYSQFDEKQTNALQKLNSQSSKRLRKCAELSSPCSSPQHCSTSLKGCSLLQESQSNKAPQKFTSLSNKGLSKRAGLTSPSSSPQPYGRLYKCCALFDETQTNNESQRYSSKCGELTSPRSSPQPCSKSQKCCPLFDETQINNVSQKYTSSSNKGPSKCAELSLPQPREKQPCSTSHKWTSLNIEPLNKCADITGPKLYSQTNEKPCNCSSLELSVDCQESSLDSSGMKVFVKNPLQKRRIKSRNYRIKKHNCKVVVTTRVY